MARMSVQSQTVYLRFLLQKKINFKSELLIYKH